MKKSTVIAIIYFTLMGFASTAFCQKVPTYTVKNGVVTATPKQEKAEKAPDPVYQIVDGLTFYKGAKGGIYRIATSKKTGKQYKVYIKG